MCGIAGVYNFNEKQIVEQSTTQTLIKALHHRGPDGNGFWYNQQGNCALVHTRLSILDLSNMGAQPMPYLNGRYHITLNGEIFNFIEIKALLEMKGYSFQSDTDTEVVLAAYHEWGADVLHRFNGMWAFAIYDNHTDSLFISRDRFGIKPLYYYFDGTRLIFASEVQAIHKILGPEHPLYAPVMKEIARGGFSSHTITHTYLERVFNLPAGHTLSIIKKQVKINKWYTLKQVKVPKGFKSQARKLRLLIDDACKIRLRSDVPIGTCLSGGLDSGSIAATVNHLQLKSEERTNNYTHKSFCASYPGQSNDESYQAQFLADVLNGELDILKIHVPTQDELVEAMLQCDGPMNSLAFYPIWHLYRHIKGKGITVTLDGQGPDEMLGGYRPLYEALSTAVDLCKPLWFYDVYKTYAAQGETAFKSSKKDAKETALKILNQQKRNPIGLTKKIFRRITNSNKPLKFNDQPEWLYNRINHALYQQFFEDPLPRLLAQFDRCSMANSIECRMPFMDYRIVEFVFSLPLSSKIGGGYTKRILREVVKGILPDETRLNKRKIGFNPPIVEWFKGNLRAFMLDTMQRSEFQNSEYFDGKNLLKQFQNFLIEPEPQWSDAWQFWPPVHLTWWLMRNKNIEHD